MAHPIALARLHGRHVADAVRMALVAGCAATLIAAEAFLPWGPALGL